MNHRTSSPLTLALVSALTLCACGGKVEEPSSQKSPGSPDSGLADAKVDVKDATCLPKTCSELGAECGLTSDGCSHVLNCGICASDMICGATTPNKCGKDTTVCVPKTCSELGAECGLAPDSCGHVLSCGECTSGMICGATSPNKCGKASAEVCNDGVDNDGDGKSDCNDPDCEASCPGQEICDGKDNDGDGLVDEWPACIDPEVPCPPGAITLCDCYGGVHRYCGSDGTWGPCLVDVVVDSNGNKSYCVPAKVATQDQCTAPAVCDFGQCIDYSGTQWAQGPDCLHHTDCPQGLMCDLGYCMVDKFAPQCQ